VTVRPAATTIVSTNAIVAAKKPAR